MTTNDEPSTLPPPPPPSTPARRRRRWPLVLGGTVLLLGLLPTAFVAWRLDGWIADYKAEALPKLEARLGRKVEVGKIDVSLLRASADVRGVAVGPDPKSPGESAPIFTLSRVHVDVGLFRSLLSLGKRPTVTAAILEGATVNVVRFADGTTNVERLLARLEETAPPPEPEAPLDEPTRKRIRNARLGELRVVDARLAFVDLARGGARAEIADLDVSADDLGLAQAGTLALSAAVLNPQKNLDVKVAFGAAPDVPGVLAPPALGALDIKMGRTEIAPLLPFVAAAAGTDALATLETAALSTDLSLSDPPGAPASAKGNVTLAALRFPGGAPFDVRLDVDARADAEKGDVDVARLAFALGDMGLEARGKLFALRTAPRFEAFRLTSRALDFDTLRRYYPGLDASAGVVLRGPFSFEGSASGETGKQQFETRLDLSAASIEVPELFRKPAGTTLALTARGDAAGDAVTIERFLLEIVDWRLRAAGTIRELRGNAPAFDLTAKTEAPSLDGLLRLLPPVAKAVPSGRPLGGSLSVDAAVKGKPEALTASTTAILSGLDVRVPDAWLRGGGELRARVEKRGESMKAEVKANFDKLEAIYADVLRKTAGTPLSFRIDVDQRGKKLAHTFDATVAGMTAKGRGTLEEKGTAQIFDLTAEAEPFSLATVLAMLPGSQSAGLAPMRIGGKLHARGTSGQPSTLKVDLPAFSAAAGRSDLQGKLSFANPERPVVDLEATSKYLDLDDFLPPSPRGAKKERGEKGTPAAEGEGNPIAEVTGRARLQVARGRAAEIDYQNLRADLQLAKGRALARALEVGVFGGKFSGSGTELPLVEEGGAFVAKGTLDKIDIDAVLTRFAELPDLMRGRLSADIQLSGDGLTVEDLQKTLAGILAGQLEGAEFVPGTLLGALRDPIAKAVAVPALAKLLGGEAKLDASFEKSLGDLATAVRFAGGTMQLTKPIVARTPKGPLSLEGGFSLAGKADLSGTWNLDPAAASALAGNKVKIEQPLPVKLRITGALRAPAVAVANAPELGRIYAAAFARSAAGQALEAGARRGLDTAAEKLGVKDRLPAGATDPAAAKRLAEEEARGRAAEAEAKARAEAEAQRARAEEEARQRAAAAGEAAKEKATTGAKEKLKGILGR